MKKPTWSWQNKKQIKAYDWHDYNLEFGILKFLIFVILVQCEAISFRLISRKSNE